MAGKAKTISNEGSRINAFQVQKSAYGTPIPVLLGGTQRIAANLIWYNAFETVTATSQESAGGKGGGAKQQNTTYTYFASVMMLICEGPIEAVTAVFRDKSSFVDGATTALAQAGLSLALGTPGQAVWPYLTTNYPDEAVAYTETAYAYAAGYELNSNASLQNHTFETVSPIRVAGLPDANPRDLVDNFLTNESYGVPLWTADLIGNLDDFESYCLAANLLLSPLLDAQRPASTILAEMIEAANSAAYWSEGLLKIKPYATQAVTGNGETWTPNLTPAFDLSNRDFIVDSDDQDPVTSDLKRSSDAYNYVQVEFLNRARQYNLETTTAFDQASIEQFGERKENPVPLHCIADADVAKHVAELRKNRLCYVRETFYFSLAWPFSELEQMDLLTLTETRMGLDRKLVRIVNIEEDEDGNFDIEAEEVLIGIADAPLYATQAATGYISDYEIPPGDIEAPAIFTPPSALTGGRYELWAAVTGLDPMWGGCEIWVSLDDASYSRAGVIYGGARYGVTTTSIGAVASPDTTSTLGVDLTVSQGELLPATQAEVDAAVTLCYVDGELLAYRDATLTAPNEYDLEYLVRGLNASTIAAHASGSLFARVDDALFRYAFLPEQVGQMVYIKFRSFNVFTRALQDLAALSPYTFVLAAPTGSSAPSVAEWSLVADVFTAGGVSVPALVITGAVANLSAQNIVFEFRPVTMPVSDWAAFSVDAATTTRKEITGLTNGTDYEVAVSYQIGGFVGDRLVLGPVTAGELVAGGSSPGAALGAGNETPTITSGSWTTFKTFSIDGVPINPLVSLNLSFGTPTVTAATTAITVEFRIIETSGGTVVASSTGKVFTDAMAPPAAFSISGAGLTSGVVSYDLQARVTAGPGSSLYVLINYSLVAQQSL